MKINWDLYVSDPAKFNKQLGLPSIEIKGVTFAGANKADIESRFCVTQNCGTCMRNIVDGVRRNAHLCCSRHPETGEIDGNTGLCPNLNTRNGKCRVYQTEEYPIKCHTYHCATHNQDPDFSN